MPTALVVEDDRATQVLLHRVLESLHLQVASATSMHEAVNLARELEPNLILMDIKLPGSDGDGWTAASIIKNDANLNHIPIILITADGLNSQELAAVQNHFDAYFRKPFEVRKLVDCIKTYLV